MMLDFFETRQLIGKNIDKPNEGWRDYRGTRSGERWPRPFSAFCILRSGSTLYPIEKIL